MGRERPGLPAQLQSSAPLLTGSPTHTKYASSRLNADPLLGAHQSVARTSNTPSTAAARSHAASRTRYMYAAIFLMLSLVSFVVQTESAVYIQTHLGWKKPYCMLFLTHGSWILLWPFQLVILRLRKRDQKWSTFWRNHVNFVKTTAYMVMYQKVDRDHRSSRFPTRYLAKITAIVACALTVAGASWYIAVDLTTASDLTAIYNCSAFFAYAFSIPLLNEKPRRMKIASVAVAIIGVLVVAYGGGETASGSKPGSEPRNRLFGNILIGVGSVLYGLYEVLYKRLACPPDSTSPGRSMIFANAFGSMIGLFTLTVLWLPLIILDWTGLEEFELPTGQAGWMTALTVLANVTFSGSFLVLMSLTSPVLSSVAALLTIFLVAVVDELLPEPYRQPLTKAAVWGGLLIVIAFAILSWESYRELTEKEDEQGDGGVSGHAYGPVGRRTGNRSRSRQNSGRVLDSDDEEDEPWELRTGTREVA